MPGWQFGWQKGSLYVSKDSSWTKWVKSWLINVMKGCIWTQIKGVSSSSTSLIWLVRISRILVIQRVPTEGMSLHFDLAVVALCRAGASVSWPSCWWVWNWLLKGYWSQPSTFVGDKMTGLLQTDKTQHIERQMCCKLSPLKPSLSDFATSQGIETKRVRLGRFSATWLGFLDCDSSACCILFLYPRDVSFQNIFILYVEFVLPVIAAKYGDFLNGIYQKITDFWINYIIIYCNSFGVMLALCWMYFLHGWMERGTTNCGRGSLDLEQPAINKNGQTSCCISGKSRNTACMFWNDMYSSDNVM